MLLSPSEASHTRLYIHCGAMQFFGANGRMSDVTAPMPLQQRLHRQFNDVSVWQRDVFFTRLAAQWDTIETSLRTLYGYDHAESVADALLDIAATKFLERSADLHELDRHRVSEGAWLQSEKMVGYAAYTERFGGTLRGVENRIDYLRELGVNYLHLMPLLKPRPGDSDGGYAVMDYRTVREDLGTMDDLEHLAATLRQQGMSLVMDLVLNHVAAEHEWAVRARAGEEKYRNYFYLYPDREMPDAFERTLPEVFPDFAPGNFTWNDEANAWVWTTFNSWQWDVNWSNPDVLVEYADIMLFLANKGVEVLRLDAIAFMWKRLGTDCQNQPEVHAITSVLRAIARIAAPALAFKAEAIVGPNDLVQYLGTGENVGKLSDLAYHNTWMVQLWSMLASRDTTLAVQTLSHLPPTPDGATWISYARCHDDIGWAIDDDHAATVGLSGPLHRAFLSDWYAGDLAMSPSDGLVFQANPATGDRRISGTMASLTGASETYNEELSRSGVARVKLLVAATYGFGGLPVIWSGDELATPNDPNWDADPTHTADNRWAHRPALNEDRVADRHDPHTNAGRIFEWHAHVAQVRKSLPQLHASVQTEILPVTNPSILALGRRHSIGDLVELYNVTGADALWLSDWLKGFTLGGADTVVDALTGQKITPDPAGLIHVPAFGAMWLVAADAQ